MEFDWDDHKNSTNRSKHNIDFRDALAVFFDDDAVVREDYNHHNETRMHICGKSRVGLLLVVYTEFVEDTIKISRHVKLRSQSVKLMNVGIFKRKYYG